MTFRNGEAPRSVRLYVRCVLAALAAATGVVAYADDTQTPQASADSLQEVVVTGTKFGATMSRTAVAAVSITPADIETQRLQTVEDVALRVPSLVYNSPAGFAEAYIRGLGSNFTTAGLESSVATYVDGVYLQRQNGAALDLVDLKSVTVLNGPQGTLYGRNATGGVILLETADPVNRFEGFANAEYGRFNHDRVQAVVNLPVTDTLAIRLAGQQAHNDGYLVDVNGGPDLGGSNSRYGRAKVRWSPIDDFYATYSIEAYHSDSTAFSEKELLPAPYCTACALFPTAPLPIGRGFYVTSQSRGDFSDNNFTAHTLSLHYTPADFALSSVTGYRIQNTPIREDLDYMGPSFFNSGVHETGPTLTHDTYVRTTFDSPVNGLLGASYERERDNQTTIFLGDAISPAGLIANNVNHVRIDSYSGYGELNYKFAPGWSLTAGARYNNDKKSIDVTNDPLAVAALGLSSIPGAAAFSKQATFHSITPRVVFSYELGEGYYYASYNKGAKSGGFGSPLNNPTTQAADQETLDSYELGAKNTFLDGRAKTTFDIFYGRYKNIQVSVVDPVTDSISLQNAAQGIVSGAEFVGSFAVTPRFNLGAGASYLHNYFTTFLNADVYSPGFPPSDPSSASCPMPAFGLGLSQCRADLSHTPLPRSPKWSGYVSADYTQDFANGWSARLAAIGHFTTQYLFAAGGGGSLDLDRQGGYAKVDSTFTLTLPDQTTDFGLYGVNLFGTHYNQYVATGAFGAYAVASMPRTFGLRISQKF